MIMCIFRDYGIIRYACDGRGIPRIARAPVHGRGIGCVKGPLMIDFRTINDIINRHVNSEASTFFS